MVAGERIQSTVLADSLLGQAWVKVKGRGLPAGLSLLLQGEKVKVSWRFKTSMEGWRTLEGSCCKESNYGTVEWEVGFLESEFWLHGSGS